MDTRKSIVKKGKPVIFGLVILLLVTISVLSINRLVFPINKLYNKIGYKNISKKRLPISEGSTVSFLNKQFPTTMTGGNHTTAEARTTDASKNLGAMDAMIDESELFLKPEEIFQLSTPIPFEENLKNPCFKVNIQYKCSANNNRNRRNCMKLTENMGIKTVCLPYFILIGFTKCGTTDICKWLDIHQDVRRSKYKEMHYWDNIRKTNLFSDYILQGFRAISAEINEQNNSDYQKLIAGECTPRTAWGAGKRNAVTGPRGLPSVNVSNSHQLTPYRIAHVLPNLKIIVTMRNPVHRLWSHFFHTMRHRKNYAAYFHRRVVAGLKWMHNCTMNLKLPLKVCSYGSNFYKTYGLPNLQDTWTRKYGGAYKMRIGMYHIFLEDWLDAFPRANILFINFEDYVKNSKTFIETYVLPHLDLDAYAVEQEVLKAIDEKVSHVKNRNKIKPSIDSMWPETKALLKEFYRPHNEKLAELLNDPKYLLWNE